MVLGIEGHPIKFDRRVQGDGGSHAAKTKLLPDGIKDRAEVVADRPAANLSHGQLNFAESPSGVQSQIREAVPWSSETVWTVTLVFDQVEAVVWEPSGGVTLGVELSSGPDRKICGNSAKER